MALIDMLSKKLVETKAETVTFSSSNSGGRTEDIIYSGRRGCLKSAKVLATEYGLPMDIILDGYKISLYRDDVLTNLEFSESISFVPSKYPSGGVYGSYTVAFILQFYE